METLLSRVRWRSMFAAACILLAPAAGAATEDISFVAEHLPEVAMDNRYASLPLWDAIPASGEPRRHFGLGLGFMELRSNTLMLDGPMLTISGEQPLAEWRIVAFAFYDRLAFSGGPEQRPLDEPFVSTPISMPVPAEFSDLGGTMTDAGLGFALRRHFDDSWMGALDFSTGLLWQRVQLENFQTNYSVLAGPDTGAEGTIDFSATYAHFTPFAGIAKSWESGDWNFTPHVQLAVPLPRHGVAGWINGPGFILAGNTETDGAGKHFGDPSVTLGLDFTYLPWNLTVDLGSVLSQAALEPFVHEGIDRNWVLQMRWTQ